jgi:4-amino-4-deoxy-L-arabinose transferase-like glycosyltransferase
MSDSEVVAARKRLISQRSRGRAKSEAGFQERRRAPRPRLAEIRRGASLKLLPPIVVTGVLRVVEFLLVAALGFAIYLSYVGYEGQSAHLVYLAAVVTAAAANTLILQALDLYRVAALSAFVRSFTRIAFA